MTTREQYNQRIAAMEAAREGKKIEHRNIGQGEWYLIDKPLWCFDTTEYRPAPEPKPPRWVAWTFETSLINITLKSKHCKHQSVLTIKEADRIWIGNCWRSYKELFEEFEQLDGSPCGTLVKEEGE